jgi:DNA-binding MarR family transcriptional regulator
MDALVPEIAGEFGPLSEYVGYALRLAQLTVFQDFIDSLAELDLRPGQFSLLTVVDANPGLLQSHACAALGIQKANLVPLLDGLQKRGLVRRVARDGRANGLHLTDEGRRLLVRARRLHDRHERRITGLMSALERKRLIAMLNRIAGHGMVNAGRKDGMVNAGPAGARRSPSGSAAAPRRGSAAKRSRAATDRA